MIGQRFLPATAAKVPDYSGAAFNQGSLDQRAKQQELALRSQNAIGIGQLYNAGMGDRSPISDYMFGPEDAAVAPAVPETGMTYGGPAGTEGMASGVPGSAATATGTGTAVGSTVPAGTAIVGGVPGAVTATTGSAAAAGAGAGTAAAGAGTAAAGAGTTGALAAMGPVGWAVMAAAALGILG